MKHASARNVIERCFGVLKMRWAILRSPSFYPIKTQIQIITACCLIHNLIRREMSIDPVETEFNMDQSTEDLRDEEPVGSVASSNEWTAFRDELARSIFDAW
ncbi:hypothetical protein J5N97_023874 [Dioscorea zingiberensis]|uniref:DDE Tnp4 domain-containing protein n=1 Tax=Dioscorea zingiberensis TaxID=325984 RepID=A0A9D5C6L0_9LILI|nr:hypothetical protein J5N97_023874 [Dioscorea zingiberensis]